MFDELKDFLKECMHVMKAASSSEGNDEMDEVVFTVANHLQRHWSSVRDVFLESDIKRTGYLEGTQFCARDLSEVDNVALAWRALQSRLSQGRA